MILCVTPEDLARRAADGPGGRLIQIFGDRQVPWDGPCGHVVRQLAEDDNGTHFHEADQYQIFLEGEGRIGGHAVGIGSVHYADGFSGYGPITTDLRGCTYYTLRAAHDTSRHLLPAEVALTRGRKAGQKVGAILPDSSAEPVQTLFERPDGVTAAQVEGPAGELLADVPAPGGRFWVVMAGSVWFEGRECPRGSCLWIGEGEIRPAMTAGPQGATAAVLAFAPVRSQAERGARTWSREAA